MMGNNIKYFITADYATIDQKTNKLSVNGFFDSFNITMFPAIAPKFFMIVGFQGLIGEKKVTILFLNPAGEVAAQLELDVFGKEGEIANLLSEIRELPLHRRGTYTVKVFVGEQMEELGSYNFKANYINQRKFTTVEIKEILSDPKRVKGAQITLNCPNCNKEYKLELNLDANKKIAEGYMPFPENDIIHCCDDHTIELTGLRRQIEWGFGEHLQ